MEIPEEGPKREERMDMTSSSLPLNDETDYGLCFACGPRNVRGLQLRFEREGDRVITVFRGREEHQGFPGYIHGGVITTLLDEVMSRISLLENRWTMTARMDVRFRHPVHVGQEMKVVAEKTHQLREFIEARATVKLLDGTTVASATGRFVFLKMETLAQISTGYPRLAKEWMRA